MATNNSAFSIKRVTDGVVSGATLNSGILSLNRTRNLGSISVDLSPLSGGTPTQLSFTNGLTKTGDTVSLGGVLTSDTVISGGSYGIAFGNTNIIQVSCGGIGGGKGGGEYYTITIPIVASGNTSFATGNGTIAGGNYSHTQGTYTKAYGTNSHAEGCRTIALGASSHAEGGYSTATGASSHAEGHNTRAYGTNSHAEGGNTRVYGGNSHAEGTSTRVIGVGSHAEGNNTRAYGTNSHAEGISSRTYGLGSHAKGFNTISYGAFSHAAGESASGVSRRIIASGKTSFIHSKNDGNQISGAGALADYSSILGGINHNIESGNTNAAIIGGNTIRLTGTTYIDTTAVSKLAIMDSSANGSSGDTVLVRDSSTGIIRQINQSGLTGGGGSTTAGNDTEIIFNNNGTLSGSSRITFDNVNNNLRLNAIVSSYYGIGTNSTIINGNKYTSATGDFALSIGKYSDAYGNNSFASGAGTACGNHGFAHTGYALGDSSIGIHGRAFGCRSVAIGGGGSTRACGYNSIAIGRSSCAIGTNSIAIGRSSVAYAPYSINISTKTNNTNDRHCINAAYSNIFGGYNNNITASASTGTTIIGGRNIILTGSTYADHVVVPKLAIMDSPSAGTSGDTILVRNPTTGIIRENPAVDFDFNTIGVNTFLDLEDTPNTYVGQAGRIPVVNALENGIENRDTVSINFNDAGLGSITADTIFEITIGGNTYQLNAKKI